MHNAIHQSLTFLFEFAVHYWLFLDSSMFYLHSEKSKLDSTYVSFDIPEISYLGQ